MYFIETMKSRFENRKCQQALVICTFCIIPVTLLALFTYIPFEKMIEFSFFKMKYIGQKKFIGIENYKNIFTRTDTLKALFNSFYYIGSGIIQLSVALLLANILSSRIKLANLFKSTLFFPYLICGLAVGFVFKFFYTRGCVLDSFLHALGVPLDVLPYWLKDRRINNISIAFSSFWRYTGQSMVLFIGAIQSVSPEFFEASSIDGATKWQQFWYITLPSIKPIVVINIMLSIKGAFSAFEGPYVITYGMNGTATSVVLMHQLAHELGKVGLASAMAVVLLAIILFVTWVQHAVYSRFFKEA